MSTIFSKLLNGKKLWRLSALLLVLLSTPALTGRAEPGPGVETRVLLPMMRTAQPFIPAEYQPLYASLEADLRAFEPGLDAQMPADKQRIDMFAELLTANTNQGPSMLNPYALDTVRLNLDRLKAIGVTGVVFPVSFPLLLPDYVDNAGEYLTFYTNVAREVKQRDMKLAVKLHSIFPYAQPAFGFSYDTLTFAAYTSGKQHMAQTIIDSMQPDYLTLISEPSTEATVTGLAELNDPANVTAFVASILSGLNKNTTLVGAGSGTWDKPELIRDHLAGMADLDYIDLHVYPINTMNNGAADYLARLLTYIDNARSVDPNKKVVISEAWLYKASDSETGTINAAIDPTLFARDIYSFWMPLDQTFLRTITKAASLKKLTFISPFWSRYFFAYADYNLELAGTAPSRALQYADELALNNMQNKLLSPTGAYYTRLINEYGSVRPAPPAPAASTIQVFAEGTQAFAEYPTMVLSINGVPVKTYTNVSAYQAYTYSHTSRVTPNQVTISYVNDANDWSTGNDRKLRVDNVIVDGATYQTESGNTYSSSTCYSGFKRSEWINCNGYFLYDQLPAAPIPTPVPDTTAPVVNILSPADHTTVAKGTAVVVNVEAFDYSGLAKVEFTLNGGLRCVDAFSPYTCDITLPTASGPYTIQAKAYDTAGNSAATSIIVNTR